MTKPKRNANFMKFWTTQFRELKPESKSCQNNTF